MTVPVLVSMDGEVVKNAEETDETGRDIERGKSSLIPFIFRLLADHLSQLRLIDAQDSEESPVWLSCLAFGQQARGERRPFVVRWTASSGSGAGHGETGSRDSRGSRWKEGGCVEAA